MVSLRAAKVSVASHNSQKWVVVRVCTVKRFTNLNKIRSKFIVST